VTVYISRPCEVEAVQWTGDNFEQVLAFGATLRGRMRDDYSGIHHLEMLTGVNGDQKFVPISVGTWIVRNHDDNIDPHYWPVDDTYFRRKYEPKESKELT
jgi:hypothetical protein